MNKRQLAIVEFVGLGLGLGLTVLVCGLTTWGFSWILGWTFHVGIAVLAILVTQFFIKLMQIIFQPKEEDPVITPEEDISNDDDLDTP